MSSVNEQWMREAIALAAENVHRRRGGPFAALVVKDKTVIARGVNCVTTTNDPTAHAEIVAIREACRHLGHFQLDGCDLYTSCEPCPMCASAIYWARPRRVFFAASRADAAAAGFDDALVYDELARPLSERRLPMISVLCDEAYRPFEAWAQQEDRTLY